LLSQSKMRLYLNKIFELAVSDGIDYEVVHHGKIFKVSITPTHRKYKMTMARKERKITMIMDNCPFCDKLYINNVCIYSCPESKKMLSIKKDKNV
jgi:hypothetical protein